MVYVEKDNHFDKEKKWLNCVMWILHGICYTKRVLPKGYHNSIDSSFPLIPLAQRNNKIAANEYKIVMIIFWFLSTLNILFGTYRTHIYFAVKKYCNST